MPKKDPCKKKVVANSNGLVNDAKATEMMDMLQNLANDLAESMGWDFDTALKQIAGEMSLDGGVLQTHKQRNHLLNIKARRAVTATVKKFRTLGEGILAVLEGHHTMRWSIDAQSKVIHQQYLGRLTAELDQQGLWHKFNSSKLDKQIYEEMGGFTHGKERKSVTGNEDAFKIAMAIESVTDELVSRQNLSGALIRRLPGYVTRQTHDRNAIRRAGGRGDSAEVIERSFDVWSEFVLPRLDHGKTFKGSSKPMVVLKNIHRSLYTGVHGRQHLEAEVVTNIDILGSTAQKVSQPRVLHFKDAIGAYEYNQVYGMRTLRDQVLNDIHVRSRSISMMENLGPDAEANFNRILRDLQEEVRDAKDVNELGLPESAVQDLGKQADSLRKSSIESAFQVVSGQADVPVNYTLARAGMAVRTMAILAKMTNVMLSAFSDKAFLNAEMAYQGISKLDTWSKQITGMFPRTAEMKQFLRYLGAAMDGLIGSTITRYTAHSTTSAVGHRLQKTLFNANFMNWWTDSNKASAVELMSAHLGDSAGKTWGELPEELNRVLSLYEIGAEEWDVIRQGIWIPGRDIPADQRVEGFDIYDSTETRMVTADALRKYIESVPEELVTIKEGPGKLGSRTFKELDKLSEVTYAMKKLKSGKYAYARAHRMTVLAEQSGTDGYLIAPKDSDILEADYAEFTTKELEEKGFEFISVEEAEQAKGNLALVLAGRVIERKQPISADIVNNLKLTLPEGYSLKGNVYTFSKKQFVNDPLQPIFDKRGIINSGPNRKRIATELETKLRTYFDDRSDFAVPTPGAREKRISIWGHTKPGTPLGEAARLTMMFKSFPITIMTKIWGRERYGRGATSFADWMMHPRKGFLSMASLIASAGVAGYMSGAAKDLLKGRTPKRLVNDDGSINTRVLLDAFQRGGGLGILGDFLFNEYDRHYRNATGALAGPVLGQLDPAAEIGSLLAKGQIDQALTRSDKFFLDNTPFINLFYIRPVLDYMVFWSLQEALDPGSLKRVENAVESRNNQEFWFKPSEHVQ